MVADEAHLEAMYQSIESSASRLGLVHYEVSNVPDQAMSRSTTWDIGWVIPIWVYQVPTVLPKRTRDDRYSNGAGIQGYLNAIGQKAPMRYLVDSMETLRADEYIEDLLLTGLRLKAGIEPTEDMKVRYGTQVEILCGEGLLMVNHGRWSTTIRGRLLLDYVLRFF